MWGGARGSWVRGIGGVAAGDGRRGSGGRLALLDPWRKNEEVKNDKF